MTALKENTEASKHDGELAQFGYTQQLKRSLSLTQLTAYGLNYMVPIGPAIIFGTMLVISGGTVVLPFAIAGVMCFFTALSYGTMVQNYPLAGSAFAYVSRGWNVHVGFIAGWVLILCYVFIPSLVGMSLARYAASYHTGVPYEAWVFSFVGVMGAINLFGVDLMAKLGLAFLVVGEFVIFVGFGVWTWAAHEKGISLIQAAPLHFQSVGALMTATSVAVLLYLGYDAVTTLAEEANNPQRDIPKAVYLSVLISGFTMLLTGYFAMLLIPDWKVLSTDPNWVATTLFAVSKRANGTWFPIFYMAGYFISFSVFVIVATSAGARLLYGMGRDGLLPRRIFGAINKRFQTPHFNILTIIALELIICTWSNLRTIASLVDFGALGAFLALNISVIWLYYVRGEGISGYRSGNLPIHRPMGVGLIRYLVSPLIGACVVGWVLLSMDRRTLIIGSSWAVVGAIYEYVLTRGWRQLPPKLDL